MEPAKPASSTAKPPCGPSVIENCLAHLPASPGVYRMLNASGVALYVGKARSLRKRVASYLQAPRLGPRLSRMVAETAAMEFATTHTEAEALLLEANLIKQLKPRYNILLRDDKSFPSILVTSDHRFPQVLKYRGAQSRAGTYYGPFASAWAVNSTLTAIQRAFLLRTCSDSVFAARTRPCLLHQIKRCSAPCVGRIAEEEYAALVAEAQAFLRGDSHRIQQDLARRMEAASEALHFEEAARYRDRIRALAAVQAHQDINLAGLGDVDVVAAYQAGGASCIQVFFFRAGCNYGNRAYFPDHTAGQEVPTILEAFLGQFYAKRTPPPCVLISHPLPQQSLVAEALSVRAGQPVRVVLPRRGSKQHLVANAVNNAREALGRRLAESEAHVRLLNGLAKLLDLEATPRRIEVYDNSHVSGSAAVGAMIVAGPEGLMKSAYRKFTIRDPAGSLAPGDDYAMMRQVLTRRFTRVLAEDPQRSGEQWPDLILIDGGAGQLAVACSVLGELGLDDIAVAAIAKGADRHAGRERIFRPGKPPLSPETRDPVLYFLQRLRDEAHRFAIGTHRAKRSARLRESTIDEIPGIGARRKTALLRHFGSARAIAAAGRADLESVPGISRTIASKIYDWFHSEQ